MTPIVPHRWAVHDRYGHRITMTSERWFHALASRPWLAGYLDEVLTTLRQGRRKQDGLNPRKYKYYWPCDDLLPDYNHLVVVVLFGEMATANGQVEPNNYVVNVWAVFMYGKR
jgi:hypothetical protein